MHYTDAHYTLHTALPRGYLVWCLVQGVPPCCWVRESGLFGRYWGQNKAKAGALSGIEVRFEVGIGLTYLV
jgi:hypothetical protein